MAESTISCPKCGTQIEFVEPLAMAGVTAVVAKQGERGGVPSTARSQGEALRKAAEEHNRVRQLLEADLTRKDYEIANLRDALAECEARLHEAQKALAGQARAQSAFESEKREAERTTATRIRDESAATGAGALKEAEDHFDLKMAEKEATIASLRRVVAELQREAESKSRGVDT
jgi:chromosome segregation ATPase